MARIHEVAEILHDAGLAVEPPVAEHPQHIAIDRWRLGLLDDERRVQAAADLARAAEMRVIPVSACIAQIELVQEAAAFRRYRRLRHVRHAVHRVRQPHAVPVHRGVFGQKILQLDAQPLTLLEPQLGSRDGSSIRPHCRLRICLAGQRCERRFCANDAGVRRGKPRQQGEPRRGAGDLQEFPAAYLISIQDLRALPFAPCHGTASSARKQRAALSARLSG